MTAAIVLFFLSASLILYVLLGGADFGAGIVELFTPRRNLKETEKITYRAIGPVWEANHMWLILAVVILFVGYPLAYAQLSTYLHIPLTLMLLGIIGRGCAFTFRHYDAIQDASQSYYSWLFVASSVWTPFFLGVTLGAMGLGEINPTPVDFYSNYVAPWFNLFSFSVGFFMCMICAMLAASYLIAEARNDEYESFFRKSALAFNLATVIAGSLVFIAAELSGAPMIRSFTANSGSMLAMIAATACLCSTLYSLHKQHNIAVRVCAAGQIVFVVLGWFALQYPAILQYADGSTLAFAQAQAPEASLRALATALVVGSLIIFPFLGFMFYTLKTERN